MSKNNNLMEWIKIWVMNKKIIDLIVLCYVCIDNVDVVVVKVFNGFEGEEWFMILKYKKNLDLGIKVVLCMNEVIIE